MPADEDTLPDLPDILPGPDGGGEGYDPVIELHNLLTSNAEGMNRLVGEGVNLNDAHPLITTIITNALLEEVLRTVAGEETVVRTLLTAHQQIATMLAGAQSQVTRAKLANPGVQLNGNRAQRRA